MTLLGDVAATLQGHGIAFAVAGAGAMAVRGVIRATLDLGDEADAVAAEVERRVAALPADARALWTRLRAERR